MKLLTNNLPQPSLSQGVGIHRTSESPFALRPAMLIKHPPRSTVSNDPETEVPRIIVRLCIWPRQVERVEQTSLFPSVGNTPPRKSHRKYGSKHESSLEEEFEDLSWNVIDREIFERQYTCRTGRPYWGSPLSKHNHPTIFQPRLFNEASPTWIRQLDNHLQPGYADRRRAVSDSYLSDPHHRDDLAHLIAVQLLGACFTLSPEQVQRPKQSLCRPGSTPIVPNLPLISSLRMHTQFRYSPCFGHQARNPSPSSPGPILHGMYDGTTPPSIPPPADVPTFIIGTPHNNSKRRRFLRSRHATKDSAETKSQGTHSDDVRRNSSVLDKEMASHAWFHRRRKHSSYKATWDHNDHMEDYRRRSSQPLPATAPNSPSISSEHSGMASSSSPNLDYTSIPVIRSEPHPVFVGPVRGLVVKSWQSIRRRLGGSLHSLPPTALSEVPILSPSEDEASETSNSTEGSLGLSRRRRARERGDIYSSSTDSTPHFNTPLSGSSSPRGNGLAFWQLNSMDISPRTEIMDPFASLNVDPEKRATSAPAQLPLITPTSLTPSNLSSQVQSPSSSSESLNRFEDEAEDLEETDCYVPPPPKFSSRRRQAQRRTRSILSEVCTPDDFDESSAAKPLHSGDEAEANPSQNADINIEHHKETTSDDSQTTTGSARPRLKRMNSSGTQIFNSSEHGIELNGLPVGPAKEAWDRPVDEHGKRRERSFL